MTPHATHEDILLAMAREIAASGAARPAEARAVALAALRALGEPELLRLAAHAGRREHIGRDGIRRSPPQDGDSPF